MSEKFDGPLSVAVPESRFASYPKEFFQPTGLFRSRVLVFSVEKPSSSSTSVCDQDGRKCSTTTSSVSVEIQCYSQLQQNTVFRCGSAAIPLRSIRKDVRKLR